MFYYLEYVQINDVASLFYQNIWKWRCIVVYLQKINNVTLVLHPCKHIYDLQK